MYVCVCVFVFQDIFRKYPNKYESIIATLCENLDTLDEPEARWEMLLRHADKYCVGKTKSLNTKLSNMSSYVPTWSYKGLIFWRHTSQSFAKKYANKTIYMDRIYFKLPDVTFLNVSLAGVF